MYKKESVRAFLHQHRDHNESNIRSLPLFGGRNVLQVKTVIITIYIILFLFIKKPYYPLYIIVSHTIHIGLSPLCALFPVKKSNRAS